MMNRISTVVVACVVCSSAAAQQAPEIGYMFPSGVSAGQTVEVVLGGYDWTPDMEVVVLDPRIRLEIVAPPGPVIVPEPPYWFGKKARRPPFKLPRETRARLTVPADVDPGVVRWQVANANGASPAGRLLVLDQAGGEPTTDAAKTDGRSLPLSVFGQIKHIEEVDRHAFTTEKAGPVTCILTARQIGSPLNAALEIRDEDGKRVAHAADTAGVDTALTFFGQPGKEYRAEVYDVDFRGNRSFVYHISVTSGPRVVATIPAAGKHGESRDVEFVGYGVATGKPQLESVVRSVSFPGDPSVASFRYELTTPHGTAPAVTLQTSSLEELREEPRKENGPSNGQIGVSQSVTGVLEERYGEDTYRFAGTKGDVLNISASAVVSSGLDVAIAVVDADGKELARNDDLPDSTDAGLAFKVPADGDYEIRVSDISGNSGKRSAVYRLTVEAATPSFDVTVPELLNVPIGSKSRLTLKVSRTSGLRFPINISFRGLPDGVTAPAETVIPATRPTANFELEASADCAARMALVTVVGEAMHEEQTLRFESQPMLVATTIKPPFSIDAEGKDDVTKWPRGSTFPAPVLIEREEGFHEPIRLEMTSRQGRHRQGIRGPELEVADGVARVLYPVFLPEWLETTRTSRMVVNGVAKVSDPQGNKRFSLVRQKTRMGFLPTGALLKLAHEGGVYRVEAGKPLTIPLTIHRARELTEPAVLELLPSGAPASFVARRATLEFSQPRIDFEISPGSVASLPAEAELTIRATVMQRGTYAVVAETTVLVQVSGTTGE